MKKSFLILGAAAMLMASCSNDEVMETARGRAIGFASFVNNSTRATDITNSTLTDFAVWGAAYENTGDVPASIFLGEKVYKQNGVFTYADERYWVDGKSYRFSAIAPFDATTKGLTVTQSLAAMEEDPQGGLILNFDNSAAGGAVDLCYAFKMFKKNADGKSMPSDGYVRFDFEHLLSRVKFTFNNQFPSENTVIMIDEVQITNAPTKAKLDKTKGETRWTRVDETPATFAMSFKPNHPSATEGYISGIGGLVTSGDTEHMYLIPLTGTQELTMSLKLTLYVYDATTPEGTSRYRKVKQYTHPNCKLPVMEFVNGYSYNFIANIDETNIDPTGQLNPIKFDVTTVHGWEENQWIDNNVEHNTTTPAPRR